MKLTKDCFDLRHILLVLAVLLNCFCSSSWAVEQNDTFSDQVLNFQVARPSSKWRFSSLQTSSEKSRILGLEYDAAKAVVSPRIQIYVHELGSDGVSGDCGYSRPFGRKYVQQIINPLGAAINWTDTASPYYGWQEACEEMGEVRQGNQQIALTRFVCLTEGTRQFTFILITRPETWNTDNKALTSFVESFGTANFWRSLRLFAVGAGGFLLGFFLLRKRRFATTEK